MADLGPGMLTVLLFGSLIAAAAQAFVPRTILVSIGQKPFVASAGMMALAFVPGTKPYEMLPPNGWRLESTSAKNGAKIGTPAMVGSELPGRPPNAPPKLIVPFSLI